MSTQPIEPTDAAPSPESAWAKPISRLRVSDLPAGAVPINVDGHQVVGALQGFGQLWQKTNRVKLPGIRLRPEQVMRTFLYRLAAPARGVRRMLNGRRN